MDIDSIFGNSSPKKFESLALDIFGFQYQKNPIYQQFCKHLGRTENQVTSLSQIPYIPIEFFKSKKLITDGKTPKSIFTSSGTSGTTVSKHYVADIAIYERSYLTSFKLFYGDLSEYCVLALLPSYLERKGSSLIYMVNDFIKKSKHPDSGFYLDDLNGLHRKLTELDAKGHKILLIGVSFALLDLTEKHRFHLKNTIVMETGGTKGRRKEMIREELHECLKEGFGVSRIHSEYGMTELLSQAYSQGNGIFETPPWMQLKIRDTEDPLTELSHGKTGGVNIIDLANINSCSFIATQDLGKVYKDGSFEILGRFDHSDVRGCNLMVL
ncbi:MAG: acyl transferase [Bacteroidota bacterium]